MSDSAATVWFLDTSSLLSMALDEEIEAAILDEIGADRVVIIDIVHDELTHRAGIPETAGLAKKALDRIRPHWTVMDTRRYVSLEEVQLAQEDVADGRTLTDDMQHWAESTIIALARRSASASLTSVKMLLSEDYDARRVACPEHARRQHSRAPLRTCPAQPHDRGRGRCTRRNPRSGRAGASRDRQRLRRPHPPRTRTRRKALTLPEFHLPGRQPTPLSELIAELQPTFWFS